MATNTAILNAVTTASSSTPVQQTIPNTSQQYFTLGITAQGNFTATITLQISTASAGTYVPIKSWNITGSNAFTDTFSYNVPYDYYVQAVVNSIGGSSTTIQLNYITAQQLSAPFTTVITQSSLPIGIPPGNGTTTGLQFTNTTGAFSLTTSVFPTTYTGIWLWMPIGAFDGTNPTVAGLYWAVMSSTSVGQLYNVIYSPTPPTGLTSANFVTTSAARWLTQTTGADLTLLDVMVQGGTMGPNGVIESDMEFTLNSSVNNKIIKTSFGGSAVMSFTATTSATLLANNTVQNRGSVSAQVSEAVPGYGASATPLVWTTINTAANQSFSITGQLAANTDFIILEAQYMNVTQG